MRVLTCHSFGVIHVPIDVVLKSIRYSNKLICKELTFNKQPQLKSGLSAGISAGVGVGSAIKVLAVTVVFIFCFHRQILAKTKFVNGRAEQWSGNTAMRSAFATGGIASGADRPPYEAGIGQPHEILGDAIDNVHEVGTDNEIHEVANERTNLGS
ncbi:MAG: hypothetical protein ASARMPRED_000266 [Alectoria sarmentosa]|nr:MAG: hypothetical protein ASARMPRED_000266 [Alectoria sarmentosa]